MRALRLGMLAFGVLVLVAGCGSEPEAAPTPYPNAVAYVAPSDGDAGMHELYVAIEDAPPLQLTETAGTVVGPTWSPDGSRLAYTVCDETRSPPCALYTVDADGTSEYSLGEGTEAYWSPDGTRLAYLVPHGEHNSIYVTDATRRDPRLKTRTVEEEAFGPRTVTDSAGAYTNPWSPDGKFLAFTRVTSEGTSRGEVRTMRADGTDERALSAGLEDAWFLAWSPGGMQLLVYGAPGGRQAGLYLVAADGSALRPLLAASMPAVSPMAAWSSDGAHIAFAAAGSVWVVDADGSAPRQLTSGACDGTRGLSWSPDSARVAFLRGCEGTEGSQVLAIDLATGSEAPLIDARALAFAWSPAR